MMLRGSGTMANGIGINLSVLEVIFDTDKVDMEFLKHKIQKSSNDLLSELESYRIFDEEETEIIDAIEGIYQKYSKKIIDRLSNYYFHMPIEMAIATKQQEKIKSIFLNVAERMGFDDGLQLQIDSDLEDIANKLNKRFTFDEASLVHLIEASKASNIQLEEDRQRKSSRNKRQILRQREDGTYYLSDITNTKGINTYTTGKSIPTTTIIKDNKKRKMIKTTIDDVSNINIMSYPGAKDLIDTMSTDKIMKQVMKNLFDNLELCVDTYKFFYTENENTSLENSVSIQNTAVLADDSEFDFYYNINKWNLPHLLGIQRGETLTESTKRYFAKVRVDGTLYYPIDENSSAFTILRVLLENKDRIIADGGLIEENGKIYQLLPWEKIILKTSSFMRGDFFKTCFCLINLEHGLNAPNEKFASISSTKYNESMVNSRFDAKKMLRDLIKTTKQKKDFIFRTFVENYDREGRFLGYVPQSIDTGKSESIVTSNGERIETLNRFRNALLGACENDGTVVKSIENEIMGERIFTPIEQALTHINISSGLNVNLQISEDAYFFEENLRQVLEEELDCDLQYMLGRGSQIKK